MAKAKDIVEVNSTDEFILQSYKNYNRMSPRNTVDAMVILDDLTQATNRCANWLEVVRAIAHHVKKAPKGKCAFVDNSQNKLSYRGGGPVSFRNFGLYRDWQKKKGEVTALRFKIFVAFERFDEDFGDYSITKIEENVTVPIELVYKFDQKKFNAWIKEELRQRLEEMAEKDMKQLRGLLSKYRGSEVLKNVLKGVK